MIELVPCRSTTSVWDNSIVLFFSFGSYFLLAFSHFLKEGRTSSGCSYRFVFTGAYYAASAVNFI